MLTRNINTNIPAYYPIESCRISGSKKLRTVVNLGDQALTGVFIKPDEPDPVRVPLDLVMCEESKFLQLRYTVNPDLMYSAYYYRSGTNQTMRDHLKGLVEDVSKRVNFKQSDIVIDTGCNDGTLLKNYPNTLERIGVDPSDAILSIEDKTITKINNYFTYENVQSTLNGRKAKVITSISMFYDIHTPHDFVDQIMEALADDGVWVVEMNYTGNMIHTLGFDMISHEHVSYYTLNTFWRMIKPHGLTINDVSFNDINGGSIRIFMSRDKKQSDLVQKVMDKEIEDGLEDLETFFYYGRRIDKFRRALIDFTHNVNASGKRMQVYGASTRGNTMLQFCQLGPNEIASCVERNPIKYGLVPAGSRIPIISEDQMRKEKPDYLLALPYHFLPEFLTRERAYLEQGGCFVVPLPDLRLIRVVDGKLVSTLIEKF